MATKSHDSDYLNVMAKRCAECLYSSARIVSEERKADILRECERTGRPFECHKATIAGTTGMCRGYFEAEGRDLLVVRLAQMLDRVRFVPQPDAQA